jgi:mannosyl-oligosaccharide alpha-1,3-glucosidase
VSYFNECHLISKFLFERAKQENSNETVVEEADMWEETYKSHHDSKPNGPESVGLDVVFNDFENVYGIPEHADSFALKSTKFVLNRKI